MSLTKTLIPAFQPSNKTKKLLAIYNQRHQQYKNSMTNQKALTLIKIKQNIDINLNADYDGFWQNRTKVLDELKTKNPKKFFKDINNLKAKVLMTKVHTSNIMMPLSLITKK